MKTKSSWTKGEIQQGYKENEYGARNLLSRRKFRIVEEVRRTEESQDATMKSEICNRNL